jgi:predicted transcriptional regulator of viral defense system
MGQKRVAGAAAVLRLAAERPFRARDLDALGVPRTYLRRLIDRGLLEQAARGLYTAVDAPVTELHSMVEVAARVPHATFCLLSALQVHELTTEAPHAVWVLIETHARAPAITSPPLKIVRAGGAALEYGVETRTVEGLPLKLTSPAKTVADCFRYRRHVGLDVALSALRDYLARSRQAARRDAKRFGIQALTDAARADRVANIMRPYIEALA